MNLVLAGTTILGINPALFGFLLIAVLFGGLNIIEFKRFD